jgi:hypothetical protein
MHKTTSTEELNSSQHISAYIAGLNDWRGERLAQFRRLILDAHPAVEENWKWDTPVWSWNGNVVAASAFKEHVKLNFFKGAALEDPQGLFNAGLEARASRAIDFSEDSPVDLAALKDLIRAAVLLNTPGAKKK